MSAPSPRAAAALNALFPGSGYLWAQRRPVLGAILVGYTMVTGALAASMLLALFVHWHHLASSEWPLSVAIGILFPLQHGLVATASALDVWSELRGSRASDGASAGSGAGAGFTG